MRTTLNKPKKPHSLVMTSTLTSKSGAVIGAMTGSIVIGFLYVFDPETTGFYPRCLFNWLTGLSCAGCGGLRAAHAVVHGEFLAAYHYNPLLFICSLGGIVSGIPFFLSERFRLWTEPLFNDHWNCVLRYFTGLVLTYSVLRNLV